jgi:hypothetical protein
VPDYFTLVEFRELPDMDDVTAYADEAVEAAAAYFTAIVEREVMHPMIPRSYTETFDGAGRTALTLGSAYVRSLTTVTSDGVAVTVGGLTSTGGVLRYLDGTTWSSESPSNIVVTYVAGEFATCPADIKDAVMWATRDRLLSQSDQAGIDVRRTSITTDFGTTNYILPGEKRPTGFPDLDAAIAGRIRSSAPLGFA